jgi:hypothetical protein
VWDGKYMRKASPMMERSGAALMNYGGRDDDKKWKRTEKKEGKDGSVRRKPRWKKTSWG